MIHIWSCLQKKNKHCFSLIMQCFLMIMFFTQQVFHLQTLFFFQVLLIPEIIILNQFSSGVASKNACNVVLQPPEHEEIALVSFFCVYYVFYWGDIVIKMLPKMWGFGKINIKRVATQGLSKGDSNLQHTLHLEQGFWGYNIFDITNEFFSSAKLIFKNSVKVVFVVF